MSTTSTFTCDVCGGKEPVEGAGYRLPKDWQRVYVSNRPSPIWWDDDAWKKEFHVCGACMPLKPEKHPEPTPAAKKTLLERALAMWRW